MNYKFSQAIFFAAIACISLFECTKPTPFGAELLDDQIANFEGEDVVVNCTVERQDTLVSADRTSSFPYFLCGKVNDPEFGATTSEIYSLFRPLGAIEYGDAVVDSIFLVLPYSTSGFYGDTMTPQTIRVLQLATEMDFNKAYRTSDTIATQAELGKVENFMPRPRTNKKFLDTAAAAVKLPYLKIQLDTAFGNILKSIDSATMLKPLDFHKIVKGLKIESSLPNGGTGAMMSFVLNSTNCFIRLHYTKGGKQLKFDYRLTWTSTDQQMSKFMHIEHEYAGTPAFTSVGQINPAMLYLQGMAGLRLKLEFPKAPNLNNVLINKAELQFYANNPTLYPVATQILALTQNSSEVFSRVSDANYSLQIADTYALFGGRPQKVSTDIVKYQMTLTDHFQSIAKDTTSDPLKRSIYLNFESSDNAQLLISSRTMIYGPGDATYPLKVRIKYTKL
jgi:Domain of unknown function (DUF4270)